MSEREDIDEARRAEITARIPSEEDLLLIAVDFREEWREDDSLKEDQPDDKRPCPACGGTGRRIETKPFEATVTIDVEVRSGIPVLQGTRFPVSHVIADLADGMNTAEIAHEYDLPLDGIVKTLEALAQVLDNPIPCYCCGGSGIVRATAAEGATNGRLPLFWKMKGGDAE